MSDIKALADRLRKMADECESSEDGDTGLPGTFLKQCSGFVHDDLTEAARIIASPQADKARGEVGRIGELIRTQDNHITSHPVFVVEQKRDHVAHPDYNHDRLVWVDGDGEATAEDAARLDAEYADTGGTPDGWRRCAVGHSWEFVTACFTEQGCKDYLAANGHNLRETRIFVYSGWRNAEWQAIRDHLATPRPQGDASGQVSGGGEAAPVPVPATHGHDEDCNCEEVGFAKGWNAALSPTQARPDGGAVAKVRRDTGLTITADRLPYYSGQRVPAGTELFTHPAPAPDVARLVEAARDAVTDMDSCVDWHSSKSDALREALAPFIAAQQEADHA